MIYVLATSFSRPFVLWGRCISILLLPPSFSHLLPMLSEAPRVPGGNLSHSPTLPLSKHKHLHLHLGKAPSILEGLSYLTHLPQHSTICTWEGPVETWWQMAIARFVAGQRGIPVHHMSSHVAIKCLSKCVLMPPCHFLHHIHSSFCCAPRDETRKRSSFCSILFVSASIDV